MVAGDGLMGERRGQRHRGKRDQGPGALGAAWLLLIAVLAGIAAWLFATADDTRAKQATARIRVVLHLGPGETAAAALTPAAAPTPAPAPVMAAPAPTPAPMPAPVAAPAPVAPVQSAAPTNVVTGPAAAALAGAHAAPPDGPLFKAPDPVLVEAGAQGPLPMIARDGRTPWKAYAKPFPLNDTRPRISIVMSGLGLSRGVTEAAVRQLPGSVTLAFSPYTPDLQALIDTARTGGHEVMLSLAMEPANYPQSDPGPQTLLTTSSAAENGTKLDWVMSRATGYTGMIGEYGTVFSARTASLLPVLQTLYRRGLMYVDPKISADTIAPRMARDLGLARAMVDTPLDSEATAATIDRRLAELEGLAKGRGQAVGLAQPYPVTIDRIVRWAATLEAKGLVLAPVSAQVNRQPDQSVPAMPKVDASAGKGGH